MQVIYWTASERLVGERARLFWSDIATMLDRSSGLMDGCVDYWKDRALAHSLQHGAHVSRPASPATQSAHWGGQRQPVLMPSAS